MGNIVTVNFHGDRLLGIETEHGACIYLKPTVERMGLDWSAQLKRIKRDPILAEGMAIMTIPPEFGGANDAVFLQLDLFHGWLFSVSSRLVKPALREKLILYQREAYQVLAAAFLKPAAIAEAVLPPTDDILPVEARKLVTEARHSFGILPARELWFRLGLPRVPSMSERLGTVNLFHSEYARQQPAGGES